MMEQPNLIKRPILVRGSKVIFGFDKDKLQRPWLDAIRVGTSGWSYPSGQGHVERDLLSRSARARGAAPAAASTSCAFYAEHFDTVEINSTFYGVPAPADGEGVGRAHAAGLRVLAEAVSEVHAPGDVPEGDGQGPVGPRRRRTSTSSAPAIDPLASAGKLGALLAQFPASFKNEPDSRALPGMAAGAFPRLPGRASSCGIAAGAISRTRRCGCSTRSARRGRRSTSRSSGSRSGRTCCRTSGPSTTCACTAATPRSGGTTKSRRTATTTCIRPRSSSRSPRPREAGVARGEEGVSLRQQSFLGEVGRQRRDPQARSRAAAAGRIPAGVRRALPGPEGARQDLAAPSFTKALLRMSRDLDLVDDVHALDDLAEHGVLAVAARGARFVRM